MSPADRPPRPRAPEPRKGGSADAPGSVVVWRMGDALLAVALEDVVEIGTVTAAGEARGREGVVPLVVPPGLAAASSLSRAVLIRTGGGTVGIPADEVEGVREADPGSIGRPPAWLDALPAVALRGLLRVDEGRIAALLDPAALAPGS